MAKHGVFYNTDAPAGRNSLIFKVVRGQGQGHILSFHTSFNTQLILSLNAKHDGCLYFCSKDIAYTNISYLKPNIGNIIMWGLHGP